MPTALIAAPYAKSAALRNMVPGNPAVEATRAAAASAAATPGPGGLSGATACRGADEATSRPGSRAASVA